MEAVPRESASASSTVGADFIESNRAVLGHILSMNEEELRAGVRTSLFPPLAAAGWSVDDAIEAIWQGQPVPKSERDPASAHVVAALGELALKDVPPLADDQDELAFAFPRNPHSVRADAESLTSGIDYDVSKSFWTEQPPTLSGMLGGADQTHEPDVIGSLRFLASLGFAEDLPLAAAPAAEQPSDERAAPPTPTRALDCGAGIGRVAQHVLLRRFGTVDLVEQDARFLQQAKQELPAARVGSCVCASLQDALRPSGSKYDVVWVQWVLNYLTDDDLVAFLERAAAALNLASPRCCIVVKETHVREGHAEWLDEQDAGLCRTRAGFETLFERAGLVIRQQELEQGMPQGLLPVRMWALAPRAGDTGNTVGEVGS